MKTLVEAAIVLAIVGLVLCLWLFTGVNWVNFFFFMVLVQPLFLTAFVLFAIAIIRDIARRKAI